MLFHLIACTGVTLVFLFPGALFLWLVSRGASWPETAGIGSAVGLATAITGGYYLTLVHLPFLIIIVIEYLALAVAIPFARRRPDAPAIRERTHPFLPALLILIFVSRAIPLFFSDVPQGLDPSFHSIIAQKILLSRHLPQDWTPFEAVHLNYPVGMHLLIAEIARCTGIPVYVVFKCLFPLTACLTCLVVYAVAFQFSGNSVSAFFSALAASFLADWGSLSYYSWGGLPNALGMFLLAAAVGALFLRRPVLLGLIMAAVTIVHHHSALCLFFLFGSYAIVVAFLPPPNRASLRIIIVAFAVAIPLSAIPVIQYLYAGAEIGRASVLKFYEPLIPLWDACRRLGFPLVILAATGSIFIVRSKVREPVVFAIFWLAAFFSLFVVFEYVYRFGVYLLSGEFYTALTPSRFLTDMAIPFSLLAGTALFTLLERVGSSSWRAVVTALIVLASLAFAFFPLRAQCRPIAVDRESFDWIAAHAEANAFVVSNSPWASYFTWRETLFTPLPASEARNADSVTSKRSALDRGFDSLAELARKTVRPIYLLQPLQSVGTTAGVKEVYHGDKTRILVLR